MTHPRRAEIEVKLSLLNLYGQQAFIASVADRLFSGFICFADPDNLLPDKDLVWQGIMSLWHDAIEGLDLNAKARTLVRFHSWLSRISTYDSEVIGFALYPIIAVIIGLEAGDAVSGVKRVSTMGTDAVFEYIQAVMLPFGSVDFGRAETIAEFDSFRRSMLLNNEYDSQRTDIESIGLLVRPTTELRDLIIGRNAESGFRPKNRGLTFSIDSTIGIDA